MNKQEAIEKLKKQLTLNSEIAGSEFDKGYNHAIKIAIATVVKLDEPEKPIVPQFVADWYEENKNDFEYNIYYLCVEFHDRPVKLDNRIRHWFSKTSNKSIQTLVAMHFFGYKIEKEKLYTVELPNPNRNAGGHVVLVKDKDDIILDVCFRDSYKNLGKAHLTEAEIKKDFDWAWQFAEEVKE